MSSAGRATSPASILTRATLALPAILAVCLAQPFGVTLAGGPPAAPASPTDPLLGVLTDELNRNLDALKREPTLAEIVPLAYDDTPVHLWPIARSAAEAHLIKLKRENRT